MNRLILQTTVTRGHISRDIQGQFSEHLGRCIYGGIFVGADSPIPNVNGMRSDVVAALREIRIPTLRWPGGCFADEYHWKDGIGPLETRKRMVNTHWGGVTEDNSFGTHEFMELCRQLDCDAYISGNVGSGTVQEMNEWVEYLTFDGISPMADLRKANGHPEAWKVKYFGVGNEPWGCGGNMTAEYYANEFRRYQTYIRQYRTDTRILKVAAGASDSDWHWTETLMKNAGSLMDGLSLHYYTVPGTWAHKGSATGFTREEYWETLRKTLYMDELLRRHGAIMDRYDPEKRVALIVDEWGTWFDVEEGTNPGFLYQQNTMRDAMVAALNLNIFNLHCDRVRMANLAQLVNVLQSPILTDGPKMVLTPTWYVFRLFRDHQDGELLDSHLQASEIRVGDAAIPSLQASASLAKDGTIHITLVNPSPEESRELTIETQGLKPASAEGRVLAGAPEDHNTFERPDAVQDQPFTAFTLQPGGLTAVLPPCSVTHLAVR